MGGFLVSAALKDGKIVRLEVYSEKGGHLAVFSPFEHKVMEYETQPGSRIDLVVK
jgi:alpha-L-fucosidase 2